MSIRQITRPTLFLFFLLFVANIAFGQSYSSADAATAANRLKRIPILGKLIKDYERDPAQVITRLEAIAIANEIIENYNRKLKEMNRRLDQLSNQSQVKQVVPVQSEFNQEELRQLVASYVENSVPGIVANQTRGLKTNLQDHNTRLLQLESKPKQSPIIGSDVDKKLRELEDRCYQLQLDDDNLRRNSRKSNMIAVSSVAFSALAAILLAR